MIFRTLTLAILLFALWFTLSGYTKPLLLGLGALSCLLVTVLVLRMDDVDGSPFRSQMTSAIWGFWPWLGREIVNSNLAVARIIIDPNMPISPTMVRVKPSQRGDFARVTHANSITLTPGTVTIEVEEDSFVVHGLTREMAETTIDSEMDARISRTESLK